MCCALLAADPIHQARGVEERVHLISQLFDVERDLDGLADIAGFRASFGCLSQTGRLIEAFSHQGKLRHQGGVERGLRPWRLLSPPLRSVARRSPVESEQSSGSLWSTRIVGRLADGPSG